MVVGMATCGIATGAAAVYQAAVEGVKQRGLDFIIARTGCIGWCSKEPIVDLLLPGKPKLTYAEMTPQRVIELLDSLSRDELKEDWILYKTETGQPDLKGDLDGIPSHDQVNFFKKQLKLAMRNCGLIEPERIEEYIARGGYFSLHKVLTEMQPDQAIEEVTLSGLRGRGGAGFPTGVKWKRTRESEVEPKYIICNGDEGDPGAYMDRSLLEGDPHSVIEGMIIGGYAIGAHEGWAYVRSEYPLAVERLSVAIEQARESGLLGDDILASGFDFDMQIDKGAGAFVCGEETALIASLEGRVGEPKRRPPYPAQSGLWGKPTNINNVETWANVPLIMEKGGEWFSRIGTEKSKGTKVFSLVGKINNTGLVEVPMGISLREVVYDIGEGIAGNREFKAVQTGGPSGGCIPKEMLDLPVDYEELTDVGSMMGSGGMIVMDERTCMIDVAKYFLDFLRDESCGKCTTCREGTLQMHRILEDISSGEGKEGDIELLEELASLVIETSLCGLGRTAPNPVLTTIRYFRDEYRAHIEDRTCPAGVCKALIQYLIDEETCNGCGLCLKSCPSGAIAGEKKEVHIIDQPKCTKCGVCLEVCKFGAVRVR